MKENYNTVIKTKEYKKENKITLKMQFIFMVLLLAGIVYYLYIDDEKMFLYLPAMICLLFGSYNTKKYLKKEKKSYLYLFGAFLVFVSIIGEII